MQCAAHSSLPHNLRCELDMSIRKIGEREHLLEVRTKTPSFGPQPWLAMRTTAGTYHYDNFDVEDTFITGSTS